MLSETLTRREEEVMNAVYLLANGRERTLLSPADMLAVLPPKGYDEEKLERILFALEMDGYFELIPSDRKGEKVYVVHMKGAGLGFRREEHRRRRSLTVRLAVTLTLAVLSAVIGIILKSIFG